MKKILKFSVIGLLALCWAAMAPASVPNQQAFDIVASTQDEVLKQILENREQYLEDLDLYFAEIERLLGPRMDFKRIARRVMAKHYKKASAEQRDRFAAVFKDSLMQLYSKGLLEYENQRIVVLPPKTPKKPNPKKQKVDVELYTDSGNKFPISYSMFLTKDAEWKIENVIVNGINIGLTYRNQFARLMKVNKNDIDLVITEWSSKVVD